MALQHALRARASQPSAAPRSTSRAGGAAASTASLSPGMTPDQMLALQSQIGNQATMAMTQSNRTGLPESLKSGVENLSGTSMDDVKVHYNSDEPAQLQAHAYAQGTDIHVGPGQEQHLPHEASHIVQQ